MFWFCFAESEFCVLCVHLEDKKFSKASDNEPLNAGGQHRAPGAVMELTAVLLKPVIISNGFFVSDESGPFTVSITFLKDASQKLNRRHGSQSEPSASCSTHHITSARDLHDLN
ncbi:uncharacterized [Tachysurus ichikawai]